MLEMAALLKAQPADDFTDPQDERRITETIKTLDAYRLTATGALSAATLYVHMAAIKALRPPKTQAYSNIAGL